MFKFLRRRSERLPSSNIIRPSATLAPELLEDAARQGRAFRELQIKQGLIQPDEQGFIEEGKLVFRKPAGPVL